MINILQVQYISTGDLKKNVALDILGSPREKPVVGSICTGVLRDVIEVSWDVFR